MRTLEHYRIEPHLLSLAPRLHSSLPVRSGDQAGFPNPALASAAKRDEYSGCSHSESNDALHELYSAVDQIPARLESPVSRSSPDWPPVPVSRASGARHVIGVTDPTEPTRATGPSPLMPPSHVLSGNRPHSGDASVTSTATYSPNARRGSDTSLSRLGCHASLATISPITRNSCNGSETHHAH
jgi:hypothetical protein